MRVKRHCSRLAVFGLMMCLGLASAQAQIVSVPKADADIDVQLPTERPNGLSGTADTGRRSVTPVPLNAAQMLSPRNPPWPPAPQATADAKGCSQALVGLNKTYEVGPGKAYSDLTDVPWLSLSAGDVVNIFYRAEPYRSKIGLRSQGRADAPIVINGVTDASCNRPVISGENATTVRDAIDRRFFSKQYSENLGVFLLYRSQQDPYGWRPQHLQFKNLKITGGHQKNSYTAQDGSTGHYSSAAAAIYAVVVEDLLIENCEITGNGNGIFVNSKSGDEASSRIVIRANRIWDNGNAGSWFEHNLYVQAMRSLYEGNYIGQLVPGALGSSLKDRSSATVVRFNHITAAARALDLVEIEGGVPQVLNDPLYPQAWVYGNLIVDDARQKVRTWSVKLIHWGGDNDPRYFRKGTLWFYNNTVLIRSDSSDFYYVGLFDLPGADQKVSARANVMAQLGTAQLRIGQEAGFVSFDDTNWLSKDRVASGPGGAVKVTSTGRIIEGRDPGVSLEGRVQANAPGRDQGALSTMTWPAGVAADNLRVTHEFSPPAGLVPRVMRGAAMDLGAFEGP
jgi:hypothetical protein